MSILDLTTREIIRAAHAIVHRYKLNSNQEDKFADSPQFENIMMAAHVGRWDQVTLMLIQEKVIDKWPS